jgi:hypothetical protein
MVESVANANEASASKEGRKTLRVALLNSLVFIGRYIWRIEQQDINTAGLGQSGCETVDDGGARDVERYLKGENKGSINCCRIGMYPALRVTLFKFAVFWVARQAAMLISVVKQTVKGGQKRKARVLALVTFIFPPTIHLLTTWAVC